MVNREEQIARNTTTMINRISEIPFWGPEEQIRRFVNQHDEISQTLDKALGKLNYSGSLVGKPIEWK
jgi:ATP-dependent Zn protease